MWGAWAKWAWGQHLYQLRFVTKIGFSRLRLKFANDFLVAAFKLCVPSTVSVRTKIKKLVKSHEITPKKACTLKVIACAFWLVGYVNVCHISQTSLRKIHHLQTVTWHHVDSFVLPCSVITSFLVCFLKFLILNLQGRDISGDPRAMQRQSPSSVHLQIWSWISELCKNRLASEFCSGDASKGFFWQFWGFDLQNCKWNNMERHEWIWISS